MASYRKDGVLYDPLQLVSRSVDRAVNKNRDIARSNENHVAALEKERKRSIREINEMKRSLLVSNSSNNSNGTTPNNNLRRSVTDIGQHFHTDDKNITRTLAPTGQRQRSSAGSIKRQTRLESSKSFEKETHANDKKPRSISFNDNFFNESRPTLRSGQNGSTTTWQRGDDAINVQFSRQRTASDVASYIERKRAESFQNNRPRSDSSQK